MEYLRQKYKKTNVSPFGIDFDLDEYPEDYLKRCDETVDEILLIMQLKSF